LFIRHAARFVDKRAVGVIEAKPEDWGHKITTVEEQSAGYAAAKFKWVNNKFLEGLREGGYVDGRDVTVE
jgi:hypothetical protein